MTDPSKFFMRIIQFNQPMTKISMNYKINCMPISIIGKIIFYRNKITNG